MNTNRKIGFIGAGNMGSAMIACLINSKTCLEEEIFVSEADGEALGRIQSKWKNINCSEDNLFTVKNAHIIVLAVKPPIYGSLIREISPHVHGDTIIVTIAAGISIGQLEEMFSQKVKLFRAMPNTPALVGEGVSAYCCNEWLSREEEEAVVSLFESFGIVEKIEEKYFHGVTSLSGSSPAYVYMFIEAMADGAVLQGLPRKQAYKMAAQTVLGAAKMILEGGAHPGTLKDAVCSPGGTTIEAVASLEESGFRSAVIKAMTACGHKSKEMTKGY